MNPELFEAAVERVFRAGAVDVTLRPIQMKKNRPAVRLGCVVPGEAKDRAIEAILRETTSFGVRYWPAERKVLVRELVAQRVRRGSLVYKVGFDAKGRPMKAVPEHETVAALARKTRRPLPEVYAEAIGASRRLLGGRRSKTP
jgi:hypothetical protein